MHINDFDDDCLLLIFEQVPLQHVLYSVARVCARWKTLQVRICVARRSLTVLIGQDPLQLISKFAIPFIDKVDDSNHDPMNNPIEYLNPEHDRLVYTDIDQKVASQLIVAFPQMKSLSIVLCDVEEEKFVYFENLLEHWRPCLESLQLWLRKYVNLWVPDDRWCDPVTYCSDLMNTINSLSALKCLLIVSPDILYYPDAEMTVMAQLESLYFSHHDPSMFWLDKYVVSSKNLRQIGLDMYSRLAYGDGLDDFLNYCPKFLSKITHLPAHLDLSISKLDRFCDNLTNIRTVSLSIRELTIVELAQCLSKLSQLIHLNLYIETIVYPNQTTPRWLQSTSIESKLDHQLSSVKILTLWVNISSHSDLEQLKPKFLFPHLQFVQISQYYNRCAECEKVFNSSSIPSQSNHITRECIQALVEPFQDQLSSNPVIVARCSQDGQKMFDNNQICEDWLQTQVNETRPKVINTLKGKILKLFRFK